MEPPFSSRKAGLFSFARRPMHPSNEGFCLVLDNRPHHDHAPLSHAQAMAQQPDGKFLLIPYCPTPNFLRWAKPLQAQVGADKLAIFSETSEWIAQYGDKGILHRHMRSLEIPSVVELMDPSIKVGDLPVSAVFLRGSLVL